MTPMCNYSAVESLFRTQDVVADVVVYVWYRPVFLQVLPSYHSFNLGRIDFNQKHVRLQLTKGKPKQ